MSKPAGQDTQSPPADAGGSPSQGAGGGNDDGNGDGAGDDGDDPMGGNKPDDPEFGSESEYFASAASADACIVVHLLYRRAGLSPAVAARRLLRPDEADSIETALALPLWQELTEDAFFQMLDDASVVDRRFGEYDWHYLSNVVVSDTMNADGIHHAGANALSEWAGENLGPLSIGPQAGLVDRCRQMQTERLHPNREAANESCVGLGKRHAPRPPPEDQPESNQISADVIRGREIRLGFTMPDSQFGDDEVYAQDPTWAVAYCNFYLAAANLWRARSCLREAAQCMAETGYIHPQMAAAIAATEKVEIFCNVLRAANRYSGLGSYRFNDIVGRNLLSGYDAWRTPFFRSYCSGLARSDNFDLKACVIEPEPAPKAEPAPKVKPPPQGVVTSKSHPRRSAPAVHTGAAHAAKRPREAGGGSTGSEQAPGLYAGKARTKVSPIKAPEPPMGGASGSGQSSAMDVDNEGSRGDGKKNKAPKEAAKAPKSAVPSPATASQPGAQCGFWDATLIDDVRDRGRDISDYEYSPTNVCMFPESWEDAMPSSVTTAPRDFEQFRNELMGIQKILDSPALVDLGEVDLNELGEPPREYISDEDFEGHVEDDGIGPFVAKFSEMESRDLIPSKQEPPYYEAKAWRTTGKKLIG